MTEKVRSVYGVKYECSGCEACVNACLKNCITMKQDSEGFFYPEINRDSCIQCGHCLSICPFKKTLDAAQPLECYAAINRNEEIRLKSSSGGIFSVLAKKILDQQGVVFGSAFSEDFKQVEIVAVNHPDRLDQLYSSKYLQSQVRFSYKAVKTALHEEKVVLFSGTPCQVSGLKSYLGKEYANLYCMDIICHGVPSPALWKKYADYIESKHGGEITGINFRSKEQTWMNFGMKERIGEKEFFSSKSKNPYMWMFLRNYCLRPSCYHCKIRGHSSADITVGDFWGIQAVYPDMEDGKGVSAVMIRTEKGCALFNQVKDAIIYYSCQYEDIVRNNSAEVHSVQWPKERDKFFKDMNNLEFGRLEKKYTKGGFEKRIIHMVKKLAKKI